MKFIDKLKGYIPKLQRKYDIDGDRKLSDREIQIGILLTLERIAGATAIEESNDEKITVRRVK